MVPHLSVQHQKILKQEWSSGGFDDTASQPSYRRSLSCVCAARTPGGWHDTGTTLLPPAPKGHDLVGRAFSNFGVKDPRLSCRQRIYLPG